MGKNANKIKYIVQSLLQTVIVLAVLSIAVFTIANLCPGDPLKSYYGDGAEHMSIQQRQAAEEKLGLNEGILTRYGRWASGALKGDMGISYKYKQPVTYVIGLFWKNTLLLGGIAYILVFGLAVLLGKFCALREDSIADRIICKIGVVSNNIPSYFIALLLIMFFAVRLGVLPVGGAYDYGMSNSIANRCLHLVLPVSVLVIEHLWYYAYMIRNKLIEETRKDYVLLCKATGLSKKTILSKCCMKNIMPSLLTVMAISLPHILGGTYVVEMVFAYPGLGTLSFESAMYKDYNMLMALTLLTGAVVVLFNMLSQIAGEFLDPRMDVNEVRS